MFAFNCGLMVMSDNTEGFTPEPRFDPEQVRDELFLEARKHPFDPLKFKPVPWRHWRLLIYKGHQLQVCLTESGKVITLSLRTIENTPPPEDVANQIASVILRGYNYAHLQGAGLGKSQQYAALNSG